MRIIIYILISCALGIFTSQAQAETSTKTEETSSSSMSISIDGDVSSSEIGNSYFSTIDSDDTYKVKSKFDNWKTTKIRNYLAEELGKKGMRISGTKQYWRLEYDGATAYEIKVDEGTLRIFVDKEVASSGILSKLKTLTKNIREYTSGKSNEKREEELAELEQERLEREVDRKMRESERLLRESERLQKEAERLSKEAKKNH